MAFLPRQVVRGNLARRGIPSPGFRELRWLKPVLAGDTISYANEVEKVRATATRPGWGIVQARNTATNQRGEVVCTFLATAFVPQRP